MSELRVTLQMLHRYCSCQSTSKDITVGQRRYLDAFTWGIPCASPIEHLSIPWSKSGAAMNHLIKGR